MSSTSSGEGKSITVECSSIEVTLSCTSQAVKDLTITDAPTTELRVEKTIGIHREDKLRVRVALKSSFKTQHLRKGYVFYVVHNDSTVNSRMCEIQKFSNIQNFSFVYNDLVYKDYDCSISPTGNTYSPYREPYSTRPSIKVEVLPGRQNYFGGVDDLGNPIAVFIFNLKPYKMPSNPNRGQPLRSMSPPNTPRPAWIPTRGGVFDIGLWPETRSPTAQDLTQSSFPRRQNGGAPNPRKRRRTESDIKVVDDGPEAAVAAAEVGDGDEHANKRPRQASTPAIRVASSQDVQSQQHHEPAKSVQKPAQATNDVPNAITNKKPTVDRKYDFKCQVCNRWLTTGTRQEHYKNVHKSPAPQPDREGRRFHIIGPVSEEEAERQRVLLGPVPLRKHYAEFLCDVDSCKMYWEVKSRGKHYRTQHKMNPPNPVNEHLRDHVSWQRLWPKDIKINNKGNLVMEGDEEEEDDNEQDDEDMSGTYSPSSNGDDDSSDDDTSMSDGDENGIAHSLPTETNNGTRGDDNANSDRARSPGNNSTLGEGLSTREADTRPPPSTLFDSPFSKLREQAPTSAPGTPLSNRPSSPADKTPSSNPFDVFGTPRGSSSTLYQTSTPPGNRCPSPFDNTRLTSDLNDALPSLPPPFPIAPDSRSSSSTNTSKLLIEDEDEDMGLKVEPTDDDLILSDISEYDGSDSDDQQDVTTAQAQQQDQINGATARTNAPTTNLTNPQQPIYAANGTNWQPITGQFTHNQLQPVGTANITNNNNATLNGNGYANGNANGNANIPPHLLNGIATHLAPMNPNDSVQHIDAAFQQWAAVYRVLRWNAVQRAAAGLGAAFGGAAAATGGALGGTGPTVGGGTTATTGTGGVGNSAAGNDIGGGNGGMNRNVVGGGNVGNGAFGNGHGHGYGTGGGRGGRRRGAGGHRRRNWWS